jgi:hypothetical protein
MQLDENRGINADEEAKQEARVLLRTAVWCSGAATLDCSIDRFRARGSTNVGARCCLASLHIPLNCPLRPCSAVYLQ